ncbi:MAG: hypothetical protein KJ621_15910 [Proteobacteria bacterium]|nr:hypothetical protein [Pseudomonadota bacterium]MBU1742498.1 hypothetical protein [Pseudomonadota bacterium]
MNRLTVLLIRLVLAVAAGFLLWWVFPMFKSPWLIVPLAGLVFASAYVSELVRRRKGP